MKTRSLALPLLVLLAITLTATVWIKQAAADDYQARQIRIS